MLFRSRSFIPGYPSALSGAAAGRKSSLPTRRAASTAFPAKPSAPISAAIPRLAAAPPIMTLGRGGRRPRWMSSRALSCPRAEVIKTDKPMIGAPWASAAWMKASGDTSTPRSSRIAAYFKHDKEGFNAYSQLAGVRLRVIRGDMDAGHTTGCVNRRPQGGGFDLIDRKSTRLNSSHYS